MNEPIKSLSVEALLRDGDYLIPMYQRNYAWGEGEITQLIEDVLDYACEHSDKTYYIGTLVVFKRDSQWETIDGQQRLTTLTLLISYLKTRSNLDSSWCAKCPIHFESRPNSSETIQSVFAGKADDLAHRSASALINPSIVKGYEVIKRVLPIKLKERPKASEASFAKYLQNCVKIMRVAVPEDTNLNHYFEVMNSRGEQLEKHEVLKAQIMSVLDKEDRPCFHTVWEACSNMERYVQMGFKKEIRYVGFNGQELKKSPRSLIFGDSWDSLSSKNFADLKEACAAPDAKSAHNDREESEAEPTLSNLLKNPPKEKEAGPDGEFSERFGSVLNFPNFLLHVLRLMMPDDDIPLDDKRLLDTFKPRIYSVNSVEFVKAFAFNLLRCKHLFDQYVIRREFLNEQEDWSLKQLRTNPETPKSGAYYVDTFDGHNAKNKQALMLLAAFHVSAPTQIYKHWLNGVLHKLFKAETVNPDTYIDELEELADSFLFERFLTQSPRPYRDIIYGDKVIAKPSCQLTAEQVRPILRFGNIENNFIFNYLDYLLWRDRKVGDKKIEEFKFTFRSSVEHYFPQHPMNGGAWDPVPLNSFGNLCLISHSKNSKLSNLPPKAKSEHYEKGSLDSIKQYLMMNTAGDWTPEAAEVHENDMIKVLLKRCNAVPLLENEEGNL